MRQNNHKFLKSELCLGFIGADSLSRFSETITTGKDSQNNKKRLKKWFNDFVLNDSNEIYKKHKDEIDCDSTIVYELRNSLLHFYGLPESGLVGFSTLGSNVNKGFKDLVYGNTMEKELA